MQTLRRKNKLKFLLLVMCLLVLWHAGRYLHIDTQGLESSLNRFPFVYSGMIYVFLYVIITFFIFFSKDIFWIAAAVAYGAYLSTLLIVIGEVINAFILFRLAKYLGRGFVENYARKKEWRLDDRLAGINSFWLFIVRLTPLIPYRFMDLGIGLTSIPFRRYLPAVLLATPIRVFWVQYILAGVGKNIFNNPAALTAYFSENKALLLFSLVYLCLAVVAIFRLKYKF